MDEHYSRRRFLASTGVVGVAALAGCSGGGGDSGGDSGGDETTAEPTESGGSGEEWVQTSDVAMNDQLAFDPVRIEVEAGTTVTWETTGAVGHTVTAYEDSIPDGAAYFASGDFDGEQAAIDGYNSGQEGDVPEGETYEHTFETTGTYEYYCIPHEASGMVGYVRVI